ncbi:MAG: hypothetical protein ACTHMA_14825 [Thermomicrobiales bacterium]
MGNGCRGRGIAVFGYPPGTARGYGAREAVGPHCGLRCCRARDGGRGAGWPLPGLPSGLLVGTVRQEPDRPEHQEEECAWDRHDDCVAHPVTPARRRGRRVGHHAAGEERGVDSGRAHEVGDA